MISNEYSLYSYLSQAIVLQEQHLLTKTQQQFTFISNKKMIAM